MHFQKASFLVTQKPVVIWMGCQKLREKKYVHMWSLLTKCPRQLKQFLTCTHPSFGALRLKALVSWPALVGDFPPAKAKYYLKSPYPGRITPWSLSLNLRPGLAPYHPLGFQVKPFFLCKIVFVLRKSTMYSSCKVDHDFQSAARG